MGPVLWTKTSAISVLLWFVPSTRPADPLRDLPSHQQTSRFALSPQAVNLHSALPPGLWHARSKLNLPQLHCPSHLSLALSPEHPPPPVFILSAPPSPNQTPPLLLPPSRRRPCLILLSTIDTFLLPFRSIPLFHTLHCSSLLAPGT